ncbi:hypothetical protein EKH57_09960 [Halorubrum sp. BOL3-1]|uniref:hypothetical protein n=1 Tax=Halorubrum sp. BOL3-1 TaxID=2497325 RepID=UPI001004F32D|nr:hypothetical protein [Halorubrum sp. BOL3-1]QAU13019.1 hypothetical protein EKH57_09960 [Halorubrum sp. BOL3-1]
MGEKTTVAFRVDESVKQEWEAAADGPEYDSLSHLIRLSVQKEITDTETAETDAQAGVSLAENSEVLDSLTRLERTVENIQDDMEAVSRESRSEELYNLEQVLLEILPTYTSSKQDLQNPTETDIETITPEEVAARIDADEQDVSDALNRLSDNTGQVRELQMGFDSKTHYVGLE